MNSKKGIGQYLKIIIALPVLLMFAMFGTIGLYEIGEEFIISDLSNITQTVATNIGLDSSYNTLAQSLETNYNSIEFPYDILFAIIMIGAFITSNVIAFKSDRVPTLSFLGIVTVGMMFILLLLSFLNEFVTWFLSDIFYAIFDDLTIDTPFIDWYFGNLSLINMVWFAVLLFLNQVEVNFKELFKQRDAGDLEEGGRQEE